MPIDLRRRCELAEMLDQNPALLQNHLLCEMPQRLSSNLVELEMVRDASVKLGDWLANHPSESNAALSNAEFISRLDEEISISGKALAIYRKLGWQDPEAQTRS